MKENWFKTKFINARNIEGNPQTEKLEYVRELFETFGMKDPQFSGIAILGSTMKGYSHEDTSDIDVALFYYRGRNSATNSQLAASTTGDLFKFEEEFRKEKKEKNEKAFVVDIIPDIHNLRDLFEDDSLNESSISIENILYRPEMFYELSYPIIETKNPRALMPMGRILKATRETIIKLNNEQKKRFLKSIEIYATHFMQTDLDKYSERINPNVDRKEYLESRVKMLKQRLKSKFGLTV